MAQARTQLGAIKQQLELIRRAERELKMAWSKNNSEQLAHDIKSSIVDMKEQLNTPEIQQIIKDNKLQ